MREDGGGDAPRGARTFAGRPEAASDEALLASVRSGEALPYAEIYRRYYAEARRYARRLVPESDVEDVVAEAFTKVLGALRGRRGPVNQPRRYLFVAVRTTATTLHAKRRRTAALPARIGPRYDNAHDQPGAGDLAPELQRALRSLPQRWQEILWHSEIDGRSGSEISEIMGIQPQAVSALVYRARRGLRAAYSRLAEAGRDSVARTRASAGPARSAPC